jgi:dipeptidyl aminopeptidase/acylaminoacyl peptidase
MTSQISASSSVVEAAKRHKLWTLVASALVSLLLAASGYGIYSLLQAKRRVPFEKFTISQITDNGKSIRAAISPDGRYLLVVDQDKGKQSLWLHNLPSNSDTQMIPPEDADYSSLLFSPDGNSIYFRKSADPSASVYNLYRAPVLGGAPQIVAHNIHSGITFSPDGKNFAYIRQNSPEFGKYQLLMADAEGTNEKAIATGPSSETPTSIAMLAGRFALAIPALVFAVLFARQRNTPSSAGTLPTHSFSFGVLLTACLITVVALSYLPVLALGPVLERLLFGT